MKRDHTLADWPELDYRPRHPQTELGIGMLGCGGIARVAAAAYRAAGFRVVAVADLNRAAAERMRDEHFPDAAVFDDASALLAHPGVDVVDIATHTAVRPPLVRAALLAGKHVQSQKPFVDDLQTGDELCALAAERGLRLAVNQNGRWSPHFAYLLAAVRTGTLGRIASADFDVFWNHDDALVGTPFAEMEDVILWDFGIHWFDVVSAVFADRTAEGVYALTTHIAEQRTQVPMVASAVIDYGDAQATLRFRAASARAEEGRYRVDGEHATLRTTGPSLGGPDIAVTTAEGDHLISLEGSWMPDALGGTMGELLEAIVEDREPTTSARRVLTGLRLCFAALVSARTRVEVDPASVSGRPAAITHASKGARSEAPT